MNYQKMLLKPTDGLGAVLSLILKPKVLKIKRCSVFYYNLCLNATAFLIFSKNGKGNQALLHSETLKATVCPAGKHQSF